MGGPRKEVAGDIVSKNQSRQLKDMYRNQTGLQAHPRAFKNGSLTSQASSTVRSASTATTGESIRSTTQSVQHPQKLRQEKIIPFACTWCQDFVHSSASAFGATTNARGDALLTLVTDSLLWLRDISCGGRMTMEEEKDRERVAAFTCNRAGWFEIWSGEGKCVHSVR